MVVCVIGGFREESGSLPGGRLYNKYGGPWKRDRHIKIIDQ